MKIEFYLNKCFPIFKKRNSKKSGINILYMQQILLYKLVSFELCNQFHFEISFRQNLNVSDSSLEFHEILKTHGSENLTMVATECYIRQSNIYNRFLGVYKNTQTCFMLMNSWYVV